MMDIQSPSILEEKRNKEDAYVKDYSSSTTEEEEEEEDIVVHNEKQSLKRSIEDDFYSKKRRKQLKPNRITSFPNVLSDMVQVPKNSINNEELSNSVPPKLLENPIPRNRSPLMDTHKDYDELEPEVEDGRTVSSKINVPRVQLGPMNPKFIFPFPYNNHEIITPNYWPEKIKQGETFRIFNQEAYCELCKKEFCNKYFLKTHKANKHGIFIDIGVGATKQRNDTDEFPLKQTLEVPTAKSDETTDDEKMKAFCDLCNKSFCNKYFVRRHKIKSHSYMASLEDSSESSDYHETKDPVVDTSVYNDEKSNSQTYKNGEKTTSIQEVDEVQKSPLNLIVTNNESDFEESNGSCPENKTSDQDECSSENLEKLQTMLLRLNPSELELKTDESEEIHDTQESSQNSDYFYTNKIEEQSKQMKSQPTSSYCEICNKELCNKYFMRTHMQRMHGIEIEHGTQIGGVVCNICNKELCSKYFLRVHKQNTHGIVSPGATSTLSAAQPSPKEETKFYTNFTQVCFVCNRRFRSPKWLQAHLLSDHREELSNHNQEDVKDEEHSLATLKIPGQLDNPENPQSLNVISKLFWENSSSQHTYTCSQCSFTTPVLAFLFVHERSHFVLSLQSQDTAESVKPSASLQNLIQTKTFWQHKITQASDCLDLSKKSISVDRNGS